MHSSVTHALLILDRHSSAVAQASEQDRRLRAALKEIESLQAVAQRVQQLEDDAAAQHDLITQLVRLRPLLVSL